jgi:hypothetical protein
MAFARRSGIDRWISISFIRQWAARFVRILLPAWAPQPTDVGCLKGDAHQRTTVDGLYAARDVVSDLHQITVATGHAAAATHIHLLPRNFR